MRPIYISLALTAAMALAACDPCEDDYSDNISVVTADQVEISCNVVRENGKNVNAAVVEVKASNPVQISNGVNTVYAPYAELTLFNVGQNTIYVTVMNPDLSIVEKTVTVTVDEMSDNYPVLPQYNLLTNGSTKKWKWATGEDSRGVFGTRCWGNWGWTNPANWFVEGSGAGIWWGCDKPEDLADQLSHSPSGAATGEENSGAYMVFSLNGTKIETYAADGKLIRSGKFDLSKWGSPRISYEGTLVTTAEAILFPWQINKGGFAPTDFDVALLTKDEMILCYSDASTINAAGNSVDGEGTFWRFVAAD